MKSDEVVSQLSSSAWTVNLGEVLAPIRSIARQFASADEASTAAELPNYLLLTLLVHQLRQMGLDIEVGRKPDPTRIEQWKKSVRMPALYDRWLQHAVLILSDEADSRVSAADRARVPRTGVDGDAAWRDWGQLKRSLRPEVAPRAELVETALRALPEILTGARPAVALFFPGGSFDLMEAVYAGNPVSDYFNELTAQSLVAYLQARTRAEPAARVRILEVGAGTGATTTRVLDRLAPYAGSIEEYCFSDLSTTFLTRARRRYAAVGASYMLYKIFDVERQPGEQALRPASYDVVLATNVLHATENIRETLRNVKACLKEQGMLLLSELSSNDLFSHLAYALLEGWWRFKDESERMLGSPALAPEQWQRVLSLEGFRDVRFPALADHHLGQQIVAAVSDGRIRGQPHSSVDGAAASLP